MSWKLKNKVKFPKWIFVPLLLDCVTARHWLSFIQISTERKMKTKLPHWFADYMSKLHSFLTFCAGIERICSTFDFMCFRLCDTFFFCQNPQRNKGSVFIFYHPSTNYSIWFYYPKTPKSWFILFISSFYNRFEDCLDYYSLF